jgi:DNA-binding transcriptional ArsR family regulator
MNAQTGAPLAFEEKNLQRVASLLKTTANDRRLCILYELMAHPERSVGQLEKVSGLSQSALSQHLAKMRKDEIVKTRRSAQTIYYSISSSEIRDLLTALLQIFNKPA